MDRIWRETLGRISDLEKRLALIEEIATVPLAELKAKKWVDGSIPPPSQESKPESEKDTVDLPELKSE